MEVITNNHARDLLAGYELPDGVLASEFDYVGEDDAFDPRFFRYRGAWYDAHEFVRIAPRAASPNPFAHPVENDSPLIAWDAIHTDTYFSGVVIRLSSDFEHVVVGRMHA